MSDPINPDHYKNDSSGLECIQLSEHLNSGLLQQAFQYVWRAGEKGVAAEDLKKALWFIGREHQFRKDYGRLAAPRSIKSEELFIEWRVNVRSDLRAAILATIWRIDREADCHHTELYSLSEMVEALRSGLR